MTKTSDEKSPSEWRTILNVYRSLRDLEDPDFFAKTERMTEALRRDGLKLYRTALRLEIPAIVEEIALADFGANGIHRRLIESGYEAHLIFLGPFLHDFKGQVMLKKDSLCAQAWCLLIAAENAMNALEAFSAAQRTLRRHPRGAYPSVSLNFLIRHTLDCKTSEVAEQLLDAGILPAKESDHNDLRGQWKEQIKRARSRHKRRSGM